jgi:hypothetical protein
MDFEIIKNNLNFDNLKKINIDNIKKKWHWSSGFLYVFFKKDDDFTIDNIDFNQKTTTNVITFINDNIDNKNENIDYINIRNYVISLIRHCEYYEKQRNHKMFIKNKLIQDIKNIISKTNIILPNHENIDLESHKWITDFLKLNNNFTYDNSISVNCDEKATADIFEILDKHGTEKDIMTKQFIIMVIDNYIKFEKEINEIDSSSKKIKEYITSIIKPTF